MLLWLDPGSVCKDTMARMCCYSWLDPGIVCKDTKARMCYYSWILVFSAKYPGNIIVTSAWLDLGIVCHTTTGHLLLLWLDSGIVCNVINGHYCYYGWILVLSAIQMKYRFLNVNSDKKFTHDYLYIFAVYSLETCY